MLPLSTSPGNGGLGAGSIPEYFRRIIRYPQMDFDYTFWQMLYLLVDPARVYRTTSYHKQTKNQWARDDPAFVVVMVGFISVASLSYSIIFQVSGILGVIFAVLKSIFIDFIFMGVVFATLGWLLANKYMCVQQYHRVEQRVEWLYAFDVHCNSFFPQFLLLHVLQYFLLPFLYTQSFLSTLLANTVYAVAFCAYWYLTFLGYNALPFLQNTVWFLYPIGVVLVLYALAILFQFNFCRIFMNLGAVLFCMAVGVLFLPKIPGGFAWQ